MNNNHQAQHNRTRKYTRYIFAMVILITPLWVVGCSITRLQAGLEAPGNLVIAAAETEAENADFPITIDAYETFSVAVSPSINISVFAREDPDATTNIIFVHGAGGGAWVWEYFFDALPSTYNLYALSWRGHFDSSPVEDANTYDYVKDQAAVLDVIKDRNSHPVHLVGHSYGGATAILQAANTSHTIESVTLLAPVVPLDYTLSQRLIIPAIAPYFIRKDAEKGNDVADVYGGMFLSQKRMQYYHDQYAGKDHAREKPGLIAGDGVSAKWQNELKSAFHETSLKGIPITLITARYDNVVVPRRQSNIAASIGAQVIELESGHYIPLDVEAEETVELLDLLIKGAQN